MGLRKVRLGDCIELLENTNGDLAFGLEDVRGVNNQKLMIRTKADLTGRDLSKFQVVRPGEFFFNHRTSRNGDKFSVTYNYEPAARIVTEDYVVFGVAAADVLDATWLYLYLCRAEFDRYVIQNSWGSSTEFYNWEDLCEVEIDLPDIETQRKYAQIYKAMQANQRCYEQDLDDLKLACDAYIENLMRDFPKERIGKYIVQQDKRNDMGLGLESVRGISIEKKFIPTKANMDGVSLANYKIADPDDIVFVTVTSRNSDKLTIAMNDSNDPYLVSSTYEVFATDAGTLLPSFLMLYFSRSEFDRRVRFNSWGSARETFMFDDMADIELPVPPLGIQKSICAIYESYVLRKRINECLKSQLKDICPILVKGSIEEARAS